MERLRLDMASAEEARAMLRTCCGSRQWVERMVERRPFGSSDALLAAARDVWFALDPNDWLEAFADHPKIGDREALRTRFADTRHLAASEQSGVQGAPEEILDALARGNDAYLQKFGYIFIVCATGLSANAMLAKLETRLTHSADDELPIAVEEQARITAMRLSRL